MAEVVREQLAETAALPEEVRSKPGHLFRTAAGTPWNASNYRNRHWYPAVYAGYAKVMPAGERERWLAAVPADLRPAAELLCIDDITVRAVLDACWANLDDGWLSYNDADGKRRSVELLPELADVLEARRQRAYAEPRRRGTRLPHEQTRIFSGLRGQPIAMPHFLNAVFRDPFAHIGLRFDRRIHRARHTYVSLVAADPKVSQRELQWRAGHADASTTGRYTHPFRADEDQVADVLEQLTATTTVEDERVEQAATILQLPPQVLRAVLAAAS